MSLATTWLTSIETVVSSGSVNIQLARYHLQNHEWGRAVECLNKGLAKGDLDGSGEAYWLLAVGYWLMNCRKGGRESFRKAQENHYCRQSRRQSWLRLYSLTEAA